MNTSSAWLDFLIKPNQLDEYLINEKNVREILISIVNAALLLNNINKVDILYHFENSRLFQENDKLNNLKSLALKIGCHIYWNFSTFNEDLQLYQLWTLIDYLFQIIAKKYGGVDINKNETEDISKIVEIKPLEPFTLLIKYRMVLYFAVHDSFPQKPKKIYTFSIPGQYDQTMLKLLNDGIINKIKSQIALSIIWLEEFLIKVKQDLLVIYYPKTSFFTINSTPKSLLLDKPQNTEFINDLENLQIIQPQLIVCQIHFDLGSYYFMVGDMTKANKNFSFAWNLYVQILQDHAIEKKYKDSFFTFDRETLEGYCQACGITIDSSQDENSKFQQTQLLHKALFEPTNHEEILHLLVKGLMDWDVPLELYITLIDRVASKKLWPLDSYHKLQTCTLLKSVLTNDGLTTISDPKGGCYTSKKDSGENEDLFRHSSLRRLLNLDEAGQKYMTSVVQDVLSSKVLTHDQNYQLKTFLKYVVSELPISAQLKEPLIKLYQYHFGTLESNLTQNSSSNDVESPSLLDSTDIIEGTDRKGELVESIPDNYTIFNNQTFAIAELERKLIISRDPLAIKDILLQLSNSFQRLPPIPSHAHALLPKYLQTCLINLPPGIRRNFIHLLLSKARQSLRVQEYANGQILLQAAENEVILFREQYQGSAESGPPGDPLLKSAATLLKYISWEKMLLEVSRATTPCHLEPPRLYYGESDDEPQNNQASPCQDPRLFHMTALPERNTLTVVVKQYLHAVLATEQDPSISNSEITCGAVGYLIGQAEYEYLINLPPSNIFYTNLTSLMTFLKCEFEKFSQAVSQVKLQELTAALKITISKFWDFINPIFSLSDNQKLAQHHDDTINDKEIQSLLHIPSLLAGSDMGDANPPNLHKRSKTPPTSSRTTFSGSVAPGNARSPGPLFNKRFTHPAVAMFPYGHRMAPPLPPPPGAMPFPPPRPLQPQPPPATSFMMQHNQPSPLPAQAMQSLLRQLILRISDTSYLAILASCLLKMYTLVKDDIFIDFAFDYQQLWPSILLFSQYSVTSMEDALSLIINRALELKPTPQWLVLRADMEHVNKNWACSMEYYVKALCLKTRYSMPQHCVGPLLSNEVYSRMVKCCLSLRANLEAAMICQLMDPIDYSKAFLALQEVYGANESESGNSTTAVYPESDDCFDLFWDECLLEYLGHLNSNNGPVEKIKRAKIIDVLSNPNLNPNNDEQIISIAKSSKVSKLIRFLALKYIH